MALLQLCCVLPKREFNPSNPPVIPGDRRGGGCVAAERVPAAFPDDDPGHGVPGPHEERMLFLRPEEAVNLCWRRNVERNSFRFFGLTVAGNTE